MLTSIANGNNVSSRNQSGDLTIGLGPIQLPKYLDRSPLVIRGDGSEVIINDLHRWAEPLEDNFTRILAENLYQLVNGIKVSLHPWRDQRDIDYQIIVTLYQFDTDIDGNVVMSSTWSILQAGSDQLLYSRRTIINEKAGNPDYPALVDAQSKAVEKLTREIAEKLQEIIAG
ncbi:MAG: PqiC family protein [Gammaproteobacteria bacterium]